MALFVVISYDIPDDKRRLKLAKVLLDYGCERVHRSVFECYIELRDFERLQRRLQRLVDLEADSLRYYILCESCRPRAICIGQARPTPEPGLLII